MKFEMFWNLIQIAGSCFRTILATWAFGWLEYRMVMNSSQFYGSALYCTFLSSTAVTGTAVVNLVQDYDMEKGEVLYNTPVEG